jgi:hypothetical protein
LPESHPLTAPRSYLEELKSEFEELIFADAPIEVSGFTLDEIDHIVVDGADDAIEEGPLSPEAGAIAVAALATFLTLGRTGSFAAAQLILRRKQPF